MAEVDPKELLASLPEEQVLVLAKLSMLHPGVTWHMANCGCCVCVHDGTPDKGWLIGPDGVYDYHTSEEGR